MQTSTGRDFQNGTVTEGGVKFPPSLGVSHDFVNNETTYEFFIFWWVVKHDR